MKIVKPKKEDWRVKKTLLVILDTKLEKSVLKEYLFE